MQLLQTRVHDGVHPRINLILVVPVSVSEFAVFRCLFLLLLRLRMARGALHNICKDRRYRVLNYGINVLLVEDVVPREVHGFR